MFSQASTQPPERGRGQLRAGECGRPALSGVASQLTNGNGTCLKLLLGDGDVWVEHIGETMVPALSSLLGHEKLSFCLVFAS